MVLGVKQLLLFGVEWELINKLQFEFENVSHWFLTYKPEIKECCIVIDLRTVAEINWFVSLDIV